MLGMLAIAAQSAIIVGALGVDFNRYYEPLVFTSAAGVGVLTGWLIDLAWNIARSYNRQRTENVTGISRSTVQGTQPA
jgi:hypothetical protein